MIKINLKRKEGIWERLWRSKGKATVRRSLKPLTRKKSIETNIAFCERALNVLENPETRDSLLKGELPLPLRKRGYALALVESIIDAVPDEDFMRMGIWLPRKDFLSRGNKTLKLILYYGYWRGGPYFTPIHAIVHLAISYIPDAIRRRYEIKAGKLVSKRFTKDGKLIVTSREIDKIINEFREELERNRKALKEIR